MNRTFLWKSAVCVAVLGLCLSGTLFAGEVNEHVSFVDNFNDDTNQGCWVAGRPFPWRAFPQPSFIVPEMGKGGSPFLGTQFHQDALHSFHTGNCRGGSIFTGNYRDMDVKELRVRLKIFKNEFVNSADRPVSLILSSFGADDLDPSDDRHIILRGDKEIGNVGVNNPGVIKNSQDKGWRVFKFKIPAQDETMPLPRLEKLCSLGFTCTIDEALRPSNSGWTGQIGDFIDANTTPTEEELAAIWNAVIEDVDRVTFTAHDPFFFELLAPWDWGMDDAEIVFASGSEN